jgi:hypothetical protein
VTTARIRNLSKFGVIADVDPYNLPPEAFSMAVNARFQKGSIVRGPVFRRVPVTLAGTNPRYLATLAPSTGFDNIIIGYKDGSVTSYKSGTETDLSIFGFAANDSDERYTSCSLGDVFYINRFDRVPWKFASGDTDFETLDNWTSTWRAKLLRSCSSALCAFGIEKSGTLYPTMIKTSEFALVNNVPTSWDETDPTTNATENILAEMQGPITDAMNLGDILIVYGLQEAWTMVMDGSDDVWVYKKLFDDAGSINANCSVEVDKFHYVFGLNDCYRHDGVGKQSICDQRVRDFIFNSMNVSKANRFFVTYDKRRKEVRFNYVSGDGYVHFDGAEGCNRSAVFDLVEETWTMDDLPFVFGAATSNLDLTLTYASVTSTYATVGGTYLDQEDSLKKSLVMIGDANTPYSLTLSLYAFDNQFEGSLVAYDVDENATTGVTLVKEGWDLDELPDVKDFRGYKVVSSVFPQARFESGAAALMFQFGSADDYNTQVVYSDAQSFTGSAPADRCDHFEAGRYLNMKITHDDYRWFKLTGFDVEFEVTGEES